MSETEKRTGFPPWLRRLARLWGFLGFVVVVLVVFRAVVLPFVLGLLVAYILSPLVDRLSSRPVVGGRRTPRWAAVLVVYAGILAAITVFMTAFLPHLSGDFARLFRESPRFFAKVRQSYVPAADRWLETNFPQEAPAEGEVEPRPERKLVVTPKQNGTYEVSLEGLELELDPKGGGRYVVGPRDDTDEKRPRLADLLARAATATQTELSSVLAVGQRFVKSAFKIFAWFVLTFMVAAYVLVDVQRVLDFLRLLVPDSYRTTVDELLGQIDKGLSGVVRGQLVICVVNGILTSIGLFVFHVKYALLLGMVAGTMSFIPVFGSILSSVPIVVVALASGSEGLSLSTGLAVLAWILGIHFLEANLFNPKIIGTAAKIHPVVVVFALLAGEEFAGLMGALLAVPIASIVQSMFLFFRRRQPVEAAA